MTPPNDKPRQDSDTAPIRLATWNLRYDVLPDAIPVSASLAALPDPCATPSQVLRGERPWSARRVRVAQRLWASRVDLVGACCQKGGSEWLVVIVVIIIIMFDMFKIKFSACR
jgi:hypothetical protein